MKFSNGTLEKFETVDEEKSNINYNQDDKIEMEEEEGASNKQCRICFTNQNEYSPKKQLEDPIITPCNCSGSSKYVHLSCLKRWFEQKVTKEETTYCQ